jgi:hypothetical protein
MSIVWKTGENRKQWLRKNPKKKKDHWVEYHATRLNLIESIDSHFKSISKVNVYNSGSRTDIRLNTSGDYSLMNESMGTIEMKKLRDKLGLEGETMEKTVKDKRLYNNDKL